MKTVRGIDSRATPVLQCFLALDSQPRNRMATKSKKRKTPRYMPVRVRPQDRPLLDELNEVAEKIDRPMSQIVRDGIRRELKDIKANHPAYAATRIEAPVPV